MADTNIFSFMSKPFIIDLHKLYKSGKISKERFKEYAKLARLSIENDDDSVDLNQSVEHNFPDFFI